MKIQKINLINFKANDNNNVTHSQQQKKINFEKEQRLAQKADSINANPITSLGYKLYRTFRFISEHDVTDNKLNVVA